MKKAEGQKQFKHILNKITIGNPKNKSKYQLNAIKKTRNLFYLREKVIKSYNDYAKIKS